ncbi:hybrid sensor histidine kinase/response regulator [Desulfobacter postgatei]|jgi:DNA-binding response OmpR family regulator|uniref:hybrid sensor histidine kinase/response regulator n=1 Tax=Desulfobacter TaxID=2289 RepID=UPI002A36791E|nr:hybrid sensor histidine kinase/response regulator [Desulfobacter postgatei]MDX9963909.1 hybrid sensor histidine kinase/response regulator [Desulfobacter postgatei]
MKPEQRAVHEQSVMVVEDCEPDIDALVACLSGNYHVRVATDGDTALKSIREDVPDIVLLDILMPGMDGFEVCRQIKEDPGLQDVLVIFVTCLTEAVDETKGLEMGAVDYITKPFNFAVIRAKIKTHLELALAKKELAYQNRILKENMELREQMEQIYRHDLKNPIQAVLGIAQIMKHSETLEKTTLQNLAQEQINACFTMIDMLNRTMVLYKMEQNVCPVNMALVDVMPIFDRITMVCAKKMAQRQIQFKISVNGAPADAGRPCIILCDEMLFYIMINNLFSNALEASPDGGTVAIRILGPKQGNIQIDIENQGLIPEPIRDKFFDKFVTYGKSQGTGIGTYSAMLTAQLHGGSINFSLSEDTDTTTISVCLPQ